MNQFPAIKANYLVKQDKKVKNDGEKNVSRTVNKARKSQKNLRKNIGQKKSLNTILSPKNNEFVRSNEMNAKIAVTPKTLEYKTLNIVYDFSRKTPYCKVVKCPVLTRFPKEKERFVICKIHSFYVYKSLYFQKNNTTINVSNSNNEIQTNSLEKCLLATKLMKQSHHTKKLANY